MFVRLFLIFLGLIWGTFALTGPSQAASADLASEWLKKGLKT